MDPQTWIEEARRLFAVPRPEHFSRNPTHCCECAEHEETLQAHNVETIGPRQLCSPAWDPITFCGPEGFAYYFPALVRLTVEGEGDTDYVDSFLTHIVLDGPDNERFRYFSEEQRGFVRRFLLYLIDRYATKFNEWPFLQTQFDHALRAWSEDFST